MKHLLLAGIAVLALSGTASATETATLPATITGEWCWDGVTDPNYQTFSRPPQEDCEPFHIRQTGAAGHNNEECVFSRIEQIGPDKFFLHSSCPSINKGSFVTFEAVNGKLVTTVQPEI